ncbi:MAG: TatD family nuclease-associated radical SAM protein [Euryarchaeota archaeon]|nr:TatD family nuclease-associated radical SAM protein [Euryarchaeota archaeon]MBU4138558.1 TatD family nuclease-associated radical SAM protein [Euryarchaeota archaeon]
METKETILYEAHGNLYLNITNRCTAECVFCIKRYSDGVYGYNLRLSREPTLTEIIKELSGVELSKYKEVVFTGMGEPLVRLDDVLEITKWLAARGMPARLDTIGHAKLLYPERKVAQELADAGMKIISVSLNAHDEETYDRLCAPKSRNAYSRMLEFARDVSKAGIELRFTVVNLPAVDIPKCREIAKEYCADFKIRGYSGQV